MRILVISNLYPSERHPAFGTFIASRVEALRRAGADVQVVAITRSDVHTQRGRKYASLAIRSVARAIAVRLRRAPRIDVVETHIAFPTGLIARPVARFLGCPLVVFAHGSDVMILPWRNRVSVALARRVYGAADLIVANSSFLEGEILRSSTQSHPGCACCRRDRLRLVRRRTANRLDQRQGVLFVGRLVAGKGVSVLLEALVQTKMPPAWTPALTVIGDGPARSDLESKSGELGVSTFWAGPLAPPQVAAAMRKAAIVVVPSVFQEGLGLVALEAMASGALVVASAIGGLQASIQDGTNGFHALPGDAASLASALQRALAVLADPQALAAMRAAASKAAQGHDVNAVAQTSLDMYARLR